MARSGVGIELPPPVALAKLVATIQDVPAADLRVEPKWDGWRGTTCGGRIWSRRGVELTDSLPDLAPILAALLPHDAVLDGELVVWDQAAGRPDFAALQTRLTAGRRLEAVAARHPAQLVCFDLLAHHGHDLRPEPLATRRAQLEELLSTTEPPISLCPQTSDPEQATDWLNAAGALEGVVVKPSRSAYPTVPGQRPWWKIKARTSHDMVVVGVIGQPAAPTSLVLAWPGGTRAAAATTLLPHRVARLLGSLLVPTGVTWERTAAWGISSTTTVQAVAPIVVEISADQSVDDGPRGKIIRHPVRLLRARPDLTVADLLDET